MDKTNAKLLIFLGEVLNSKRQIKRKRLLFAVNLILNLSNESLKKCQMILKEQYPVCMSFVYLVPVRLLLSSVAVLYHVNGWLQRAC